MSKNITLMGASYTAVPAVQLPQTGGGTALFTDVSDTTALAADVASGKYFYLATGEKVEGSGSGGGGMVTEVIVPEQTVTSSQEDYQLTYSEAIVQDQWYLVTINGTAKVCTGITLWGGVQLFWGYYVNVSYYSGLGVCLEITSSSYYGTYTVKVEKITSGVPIYVTKSITANGTYNASSDGADGYSSVTVNVSGGVTPAGTKVISITENGTTTEDVSQYADVQISVNVSSGSSKNTQTAQSTTRRNNTALGSITSLTCAKAGTYDVYWTCARSNTSQTWGSQLYIGGSAYGTENTTWTNNVQNNHLENVSISANTTVAVYGRSRSGYYIYAPQLTIVEA